MCVSELGLLAVAGCSHNQGAGIRVPHCGWRLQGSGTRLRIPQLMPPALASGGNPRQLRCTPAPAGAGGLLASHTAAMRAAI